MYEIDCKQPEFEKAPGRFLSRHAQRSKKNQWLFVVHV